MKISTIDQGTCIVNELHCAMGNLTCSRHATYLHTIYVKSPETHILSQGLLWLPKSRSQKNRQVPVLKVRSQFRSQLKFLQGVNFFEPKLWMIACTTTSFMFRFMYKWSGFVCTNVNVCIVLLFFISISSSKTKRFI